MSNLQNQKNRIKDAYIKGIVEVNDFEENYKVIEEKLNLLEQKRIQAIDLNKQSFTPQQIMADRDVAKEKLIRSNKFYDILMEQWENKTKEESTITTTVQMNQKDLKEIQETAQERINIIVEQLKNKNNLTEEMKNTNQLYWVSMMNNFKNTAEEIVYQKLIYV